MLLKCSFTKHFQWHLSNFAAFCDIETTDPLDGDWNAERCSQKEILERIAQTDTNEDLNTAEQEHDQQRDSPTLRQPTQATARGRRRQRGRGQRDREHAPHRQPTQATARGRRRQRGRGQRDREHAPHRQPIARHNDDPLRQWTKRDLPQAKKDRFAWNGPIPAISDEHISPANMFEKFFDNDLLEMIARETEQYARQKDYSFHIDVPDLKLFIAILITSGAAPLPSRRLYWENFPDVHNKAIAGSMTRNRFEEILQYLHLANNDTLAADDKLAKIRPLIDMLNERFLAHFPVCQDLSIDE